MRIKPETRQCLLIITKYASFCIIKCFVVHNNITKSKNLMEIKVTFTALWRKREKSRERKVERVRERGRAIEID